MGNKPGGIAAKLTGRSGGDKVERDSLSSAVKKDKVVAVPNTAGKNGTNTMRAGGTGGPAKAASKVPGAAGKSAPATLTPPPTPSSAPASASKISSGGCSGGGSSSSSSSISSDAGAAAFVGGAGAPGGKGTGGDFSHFDSRLTSADFDLLKVLGKGSFGKVMLVKKKDDPESKLYALKTLRKAALVKRNQLAHTTTERKILQDIHCPFLVHLVFAFQTADKLYMVLDYMAGGELFFWLKQERKFSETRCRLYTAEITLALDALHKANIVYRDLKPENILLDAVGHIRLTDFGLAKSGVTSYNADGGTKTFCGTPEYLAPEILENKGHGKAVDWWALGTLLFEMLTGLPPFYDTNIHKMYQKILNDPIKFPKGESRAVSAGAKDILNQLLERKISDRLGSRGGEEVQEVDFFANLDFSRVYERGYVPEFRPPEARSETDVRNFDREFTSEAAMDSLVVSNMTSTMQEKTAFEGFSYAGNPKM